MARYSPAELKQKLSAGLLSFPVTAFKSNLDLDVDAYKRHVAWQSSHAIAGLFIAGGTGEGFSLDVDEYRTVIGAAMNAAVPGVPICGSASGSTRNARQNALATQAADADGLLVLPPYLAACTQDGLYQHVAAICDAVDIGVIVYNRGNAIYAADTLTKLAEKYPHFIGFKDATGNVEQLLRVITTNGDRLFYLGGLPTAELYALSLLQLGVTTYSSAMFNFLPEFALTFYREARAGNREQVLLMLKEVILPYVRIRDRVPGYGVSIIKAGLEVVGRPAGPVRPPLKTLTSDELDMLAGIVQAAAQFT